MENINSMSNVISIVAGIAAIVTICFLAFIPVSKSPSQRRGLIHCVKSPPHIQSVNDRTEDYSSAVREYLFSYTVRM